ncbi:MAG: TPM domain-containing protein [Oscillospiraceae bacterium]|nr:TPM domain-containing protein [Oscillospiraceae bacterium]
MKNLKKVIVLFITVLFFAFPVQSVSAASYGFKLDDQDGSLSENESARIENKMKSFSDKLGINIAIVITSDKGFKSSMEYADDQYDSIFGINTQGILLLIDNDTQYDWISTSGDAPKFTIKRYQPYIDPILDDISPMLKNGHYYTACDTFLDDVQKYAYHKVFSSLGIGAVISLIISAIAYGVISHGYKNNKKYSARNYTSSNDSKFTEKTDVFVREYTQKVKIESNSGGSGSHSGSHHSSSGGHHGGGGRHR